MIYIHIPFCKTFCTYCDFYSETCISTEDINAFEAAIVEEIRYRKSELLENAKKSENTLYIGGGTPSVLPPSVYKTILNEFRNIGLDTNFTEFTLEVNPEDIVIGGDAYVREILTQGVNRISMGIQSFDDSILKWMNRRHNAKTAEDAFAILRRSGVENISIDLIFGLSQLSSEQWRATIQHALSICHPQTAQQTTPEHISAYQLSIESGSALAQMVCRNKYKEADSDVCARQYSILCEELRLRGYNHYEISNFAKEGYQARHNSAYWNHSEYVGLGPGAHSFKIVPHSVNPSHPNSLSPDSSSASTTSEFSASKYYRSWNKDSLKSYITAAKNKDFILIVESECLDQEQIGIEKLMLGLRTSKGLSMSEIEQLLYRRNLNAPVLNKQEFDRFIKNGTLIETLDNHIRIPETSLFISDAIIRDLLMG